jgi:hypothetical protein
MNRRISFLDSRQKRRTTAVRTLLVALAVGFVVTGGSRAQNSDEPSRAPTLPAFVQSFIERLQSRNKPTANMEPREIALVSRAGGVTRLRIPTAYINRVGGRELFENGSKDGPAGFVAIVAYLPDLIPRYLAEQTRNAVSGSPPTRLALDDYEQGVMLHVTAANPENWISRLERTKRQYTYDRDEGEFHVYFDAMQPLRDSEGRRWNEILIPIGTEDAIIECSLGQTGRRLGCRISLAQKGIVYIDSHMWSGQLHQWRSIVARGEALTNMWIVQN